MASEFEGCEYHENVVLLGQAFLQYREMWRRRRTTQRKTEPTVEHLYVAVGSHSSPGPELSNLMS